MEVTNHAASSLMSLLSDGFTAAYMSNLASFSGGGH